MKQIAFPPSLSLENNPSEAHAFSSVSKVRFIFKAGEQQMWMGGNQRGAERYPGLIMRKESEYAFKNKMASVGMDPDCGDGSSGQ